MWMKRWMNESTYGLYQVWSIKSLSSCRLFNFRSIKNIPHFWASRSLDILKTPWLSHKNPVHSLEFTVFTPTSQISFQSCLVIKLVNLINGHINDSSNILVRQFLDLWSTVFDPFHSHDLSHKKPQDYLCLELHQPWMKPYISKSHLKLSFPQSSSSLSPSFPPSYQMICLQIPGVLTSWSQSFHSQFYLWSLQSVPRAQMESHQP